ncbi:MAG: OmpA family protein [Polyangiaceae bacterium]
MFLRRSPAGLVFFAVALGAVGCGPSEDEYRAKVAEVASLKGQLDAEQARSKKAKAEIDEAQVRIEQLKKQLAAAGVDISNLNANLEQQARALEDYRRRADQLEQIKKRFASLRDKLQALSKLGLNVTTRDNRMVIQLPGDALFDANRETIKKDGEAILLKVAEVIRNDKGLADRSFQVAGHTDNAPIKGGRFKDSWALSAMRAREVLTFLVKAQDKGGGGLTPSKWSAAGYGDTDPLKPNDTPDNMAANRRCELVVVPSTDEMIDLKSLTQVAAP